MAHDAGILPPGTLDRVHLARSNREKIEQAYAQALAFGVDTPVVFVMDVRDRLARKVAERLIDRSVVDELIEESDRQREVPTAVRAVACQQVLEGVLSAVQPDDAASNERDLIEVCKSDCVPVVVIAEGDLTFLPILPPARN